jgi:hypothetical protein
VESHEFHPTPPVVTIKCEAPTQISSETVIPLSTPPTEQPMVPRAPIYNKKAALIAKKRVEKESLSKHIELHKAKSQFYSKLIQQQKDLLTKVN